VLNAPARETAPGFFLTLARPVPMMEHVWKGQDSAISMAAYRIYLIDGKNHISKPPQIIECEGDEAAIAEATQYLDGHDLEIWDGARLVKRIPSKDAS
jgi:hypothetical protein